jgi:hypothetical protein
MLTQRRASIALAAVLAAATISGGALVTVLASPSPAPAVHTAKLQLAPAPAAPSVHAFTGEEDDA